MSVEKIMNSKEIGERLRKLRGDKSQLTVANAIGVSNMAISSYERGERIPTDDIKIAISKYFNKSVEEIFFANEVNS